MGLFGKNKKAVSPREFKKSVRNQLSTMGLDTRELNEVAMIFRADLDEPSDLQRGIDAQELAAGIAWMRANTKMHHLSEVEINAVEETLKKYI